MILQRQSRGTISQEQHREFSILITLIGQLQKLEL